MGKCNFCLYKLGCIGELPDEPGCCIGFCVPKELTTAYEQHLEKKKKEQNNFYM